MCSGWLECCFADAFTKACFRDTWMLWWWGFRRRMMYQPHVEAKVNKQISSYAYFFSLASLSMNNIKDGASFVFLQCWSQLLNNKKIKPKHSMFVETVSLLKHFWKAWKHFEELCTAPEFPSFYVLSFYLPLAITVTGGATLVLYPELFLQLPLRQIIEVHASPLLSTSLELEAQPFQVNIYQTQ